MLGCIFPDQWEVMIENEVRMTTYTVEMAKGVSNLAVKMGKDAYIHIKLDTGMSRLGFQIHEDSVDAIEEISKMPGLKLEGMFTHFAKADETDKAYNTGTKTRKHTITKKIFTINKRIFSFCRLLIC